MNASVEAQLRDAAALVYVEELAEPQLSSEDAHHLANVLRVGPEEVVIACDGRGATRECRLRVATEQPGGARPGRRRASTPAVMLEVCGAPVRRDPLEPLLGVAFALVKGERSEWTVQKLTELGVDVIWPLLTARTVVRLTAPERERRGERLRRVAREAAAQSRRTFLPEVFNPVPMAEFGPEVPGTVLAEPGGGPLPADARVVLVGPEGGWSEKELPATLPRVGLGPTVLRVETAALFAAALLVARRAGLSASP